MNDYRYAISNRFSSYTLNAHFIEASLYKLGKYTPRTVDVFTLQSHVTAPSGTPLLADGIWMLANPHATDKAPTNFLHGGPVAGSPGLSFHHFHFEMGTMAVSRHGQSSANPPRAWSPAQRLPGAVNVAFFDGHVEQTPLDRLWQLHWHRDYKPPLKRPGLP